MRKSIHWLKINIIFIVVVHSMSFAQLYERKIIEYVRLISEGKSELVGNRLPELEKKIPRAAGLIYIEGLVATNGEEAIKCFKVIADSFPRSDWADDALARLFEYNQNTGNYTEAEQDYNRMKAEYPKSTYLTSNYLQDMRFSKPQHTESQGNEFAVQIGAFSLKENAEKLYNRFRNEGYKVDVYENLLDGKNLLYLVWIGSYTTLEDAQRIQAELKAKYSFDSVIRTRSSWKKW
jgi:tetratricopeptide (TPR) repeat protein